MSYLKHKPTLIEEMMANNAKKIKRLVLPTNVQKRTRQKVGKGIDSMSLKEKKISLTRLIVNTKRKR